MGNLASSGTPRASNSFLADSSRSRHPHPPDPEVRLDQSGVEQRLAEPPAQALFLAVCLGVPGGSPIPHDEGSCV